MSWFITWMQQNKSDCVYLKNSRKKSLNKFTIEIITLSSLNCMKLFRRIFIFESSQIVLSSILFIIDYAICVKLNNINHIIISIQSWTHRYHFILWALILFLFLKQSINVILTMICKFFKKITIIINKNTYTIEN